jgi:hypothetical protein
VAVDGGGEGEHHDGDGDGDRDEGKDAIERTRERHRLEDQRRPRLNGPLADEEADYDGWMARTRCRHWTPFTASC